MRHQLAGEGADRSEVEVGGSVVVDQPQGLRFADMTPEQACIKGFTLANTLCALEMLS